MLIKNYFEGFSLHGSTGWTWTRCSLPCFKQNPRPQSISSRWSSEFCLKLYALSMNMIVQPTNDIPRSVSPMPAWVHCRANAVFDTNRFEEGQGWKKTGRFYWLLHKGFRISRLNGYALQPVFSGHAPEFHHHHTSFHVFQETWAHAIAVLDGRWWHQGSSNLEETTCLNIRKTGSSSFCLRDVIKPENFNSQSNRSMKFTCRAKENLRW